MKASGVLPVGVNHQQDEPKHDYSPMMLMSGALGFFIPTV
jgi:hypothetical protein